jgi:hypothetical protein
MYPQFDTPNTAHEMKSILDTFFGPQPKKNTPLSVQIAPSANSTPAASPVALEGNIGTIAIENIFQLFDYAALTGKLEVQAPNNSGCFFFRKGVLIHGLLQINQRKIGQILLDSQVITEEQLQQCLLLHEQAHADKRFGQIVLEQGYLKPDGLDNTLLRQVKDAFFEALSWSEGSFRFYPNLAPASDAVKLYARIDHLLLEGMFRIDQAALRPEEELEEE